MCVQQCSARRYLDPPVWALHRIQRVLRRLYNSAEQLIKLALQYLCSSPHTTQRATPAADFSQWFAQTSRKKFGNSVDMLPRARNGRSDQVEELTKALELYQCFSATPLQCVQPHATVSEKWPRTLKTLANHSKHAGDLEFGIDTRSRRLFVRVPTGNASAPNAPGETWHDVLGVVWSALLANWNLLQNLSICRHVGNGSVDRKEQKMKRLRARGRRWRNLLQSEDDGTELLSSDSSDTSDENDFRRRFRAGSINLSEAVTLTEFSYIIAQDDKLCYERWLSAATVARKARLERQRSAIEGVFRSAQQVGMHHRSAMRGVQAESEFVGDTAYVAGRSHSNIPVANGIGIMRPCHGSVITCGLFLGGEAHGVGVNMNMDTGEEQKGRWRHGKRTWRPPRPKRWMQ